MENGDQAGAPRSAIINAHYPQEPLAMSLVKRVCKEILPPIALRALKGLTGRNGAAASPPPAKPPVKPQPSGVQQESKYYDTLFDNSDKYRCHYTQSHYYAQWSVVADRMLRAGVKAVLDIGCGPGQFAALLRDRGLKQYVGLDFSASAITRAREVCPEFEFRNEDVFKSNVFSDYGYDCLFCGEFLEHIEQDLDVIRRIRPGCHVFASVPNFFDPSHVRIFSSAAEVSARYQEFFSDMSVTEFRFDQGGLRFYVFEGIMR